MHSEFCNPHTVPNAHVLFDTQRALGVFNDIKIISNQVSYPGPELTSAKEFNEKQKWFSDFSWIWTMCLRWKVHCGDWNARTNKVLRLPKADHDEEISMTVKTTRLHWCKVLPHGQLNATFNYTRSSVPAICPSSWSRGIQHALTAPEALNVLRDYCLCGFALLPDWERINAPHARCVR